MTKTGRRLIEECNLRSTGNTGGDFENSTGADIDELIGSSAGGRPKKSRSSSSSVAVSGCGVAKVMN